MDLVVILLGGATLAGAVGAMSLRNLVHGLLCLALSFLGLAGLYLSLAATFIGLVQILVYLGAVAILVVFAILLTRGGASLGERLTGRGSWVLGVGTAVLVLGALAGSIIWGPTGGEAGGLEPSVRALGEAMITEYVLPLEAMALLLTGALIGAVVLAMAPSGAQESGRAGVTTSATPTGAKPDLESARDGAAGKEGRE